MVETQSNPERERAEFRQNFRYLLGALLKSPVLLSKGFWKAGLAPVQIHVFSQQKIKGLTTKELTQFKNYDPNVLQCLLVNVGNAERLKSLSPDLIWYLGAYDFNQITMLLAHVGNIDQIMQIPITRIGLLGSISANAIPRFLKAVGGINGLKNMSTKEFLEALDTLPGWAIKKS
ncbi:MAG: hypothetical protein V2A63_01005 [Patescibacteria group bacterium]